MASLLVLPIARLTDSNGDIIANGRLYSYLTGTLAPVPTYTTDTLGVSHGDYVQADSSGLLPPIYIDPAISYRFKVKRETSPGSGVFQDVPGMDFDPVASTSFEGTIGFFDTFAGSAPTIPSYVTRARTSGYTELEVGAADYVYDPDVDSAYVAANIHTSFLAEDGRGFRLSLGQVITPYMFGATFYRTWAGSFDELDGSDDQPALQAFFDFCSIQRVEQKNWGGVYKLSGGQGLVMGGDRTTNDNIVFTDGGEYVGSMVLCVATLPIEGAVFTNRQKRCERTGPISVLGEPVDGGEWESRMFDIGVKYESYAQLQVAGPIFVVWAKIAGVMVQSGLIGTGLPDNTFGTDFENIYCYGCGIGAGNDYSGMNFGITLGYSARTNSGIALAQSQKTELTVTGLGSVPDSVINNTYGLSTFANINGRYYLVTDWNVAGGKIKVFPWVPSGDASTGNVKLVHGGGFITYGGDSGVLTGRISATACGIGYYGGALYPGCHHGTFQGNAVGMVIGSGMGNATVGGSMDGYWENNEVDFIWNAVPTYVWSYQIISEHAFNISKVWWPGPRSSTSSTKLGRLGIPISLFLNHRGHIIQSLMEEQSNGTNDLAYVYMEQGPKLIVVDSDSPTIDVPNIALENGTVDEHVADFQGILFKELVIVGSASSGGPSSGSATFRCNPAARFNGGALGANLVVTGLTGPTKFLIFRRRSNLTNIIVKKTVFA